MHFAAHAGHVPVVQALLAAGAAHGKAAWPASATHRQHCGEREKSMQGAIWWTFYQRACGLDILRYVADSAAGNGIADYNQERVQVS